MENQSKEITITFGTLFKVLKSKFLWLIVAALVTGLLSSCYCLITYSPVYTSDVSFYLLNTEFHSNSSASASQQYNSMLLAQRSAEDCVYMLTMKDVREQASKEIGLSAGQTVSLKVEMPISEDSCIITIHATSSDPEVSYQYANKIFEIGKPLVKETSGLDMNIISHGEVATSPSNDRITVLVPVSMLVATFLVYAVFLCLHLFRNKITSPADAEAALGVSVLGVIPNRDEIGGKHYGKYYSKYYGKYYGNENIAENGGNHKS